MMHMYARIFLLVNDVNLVCSNCVLFLVDLLSDMDKSVAAVTLQNCF